MPFMREHGGSTNNGGSRTLWTMDPMECALRFHRQATIPEVYQRSSRWALRVEWRSTTAICVVIVAIHTACTRGRLKGIDQFGHFIELELSLSACHALKLNVDDMVFLVPCSDLESGIGVYGPARDVPPRDESWECRAYCPTGP